MVIHLESLRNELLALEKDFPGVSKRVIVDPDAFIVFDKHIEADKLKNAHLGTTSKGIGEAYLDKMGRTGTKIYQLVKDNAPIIQSLREMGVSFKHFLELLPEFERSKILFESAQSILLSINDGIYPFVSCGDPGLSGIVAAGFGRLQPSKIYGIAKGCYTTRVGTGALPTEMNEKEAAELREKGSEYGSVSGRPRRIGYLDLPALKYAADKGCITDLIITKLDILNGKERIAICHRYDKQPVSGQDFFSVKPSYMEISGWKDAKNVDQLKDLIHTVEYYVGKKVAFITAGVNREDMIEVK
jgi:adenylosuccinate synthase